MFSQTLNNIKETDVSFKNSKTNEKINLINSSSEDSSNEIELDGDEFKNKKILKDKFKCETIGCDGTGHIKNQDGKIFHHRHYKSQNCPKRYLLIKVLKNIKNK